MRHDLNFVPEYIWSPMLYSACEAGYSLSVHLQEIAILFPAPGLWSRGKAEIVGKHFPELF